MRHVIRAAAIAALVVGLAACGQRGDPAATTDGGDISAPALPLGGPDTIQPGQWRTTVQLTAVDAEGLPPGMAQQMMAPAVIEDCVTSEDVRQFARADQDGESGECSRDELQVGNGRISGTMVCASEGGETRIVYDGTFTSTRLDMTSQMEAGTAMGGMKMSSKVVSERIGDCPG